MDMNESNVKGVSIRAILAFIIVLACCGVAVWTKELLTLKDLAFLVLGFYFGQKPVTPANTTTTTTTASVIAPVEAPKPPTTKEAGKTDFRVLIFIVFMAFLGGCASYGLNTACIHGSNSKATIPYGGGEGNGDVIFCHSGCIGFNCGKPDMEAFANEISAYIKAQEIGNKITTTGPGTITFTPVSK